MSPHCPNNSWISGETNFLYYHVLTTTHFWPITICCSLLKRKLNVKEKDLHSSQILCSITGCLLPTVLRPCSSLISGGFVIGHLTLWWGHYTVSKWTTKTQWWSMYFRTKILNGLLKPENFFEEKDSTIRSMSLNTQWENWRLLQKESSVVCKNIISCLTWSVSESFCRPLN